MVAAYSRSRTGARAVRSRTVPVPRLGIAVRGRMIACGVLMAMPAALLACAILLGGQQAVPPPGSPSSPAATSDGLPVSLDRIQRALAAPPPIDLKEQHPVFRLEIFGRKPTLEDILGEKYWIGPSSYGSMTHQQFLEMVTPKELQPFGGFSGKYLVAETALTIVEQWALKSAIRKFQAALNDREREAARKEVLEALAELEKARREAGLSK